MTWSPRNRTDDGSSMDGEDKPDNEDGLGGDDDDDISIGKWVNSNILLLILWLAAVEDLTRFD